MGLLQTLLGIGEDLDHEGVAAEVLQELTTCWHMLGFTDSEPEIRERLLKSAGNIWTPGTLDQTYIHESACKAVEGLIITVTYQYRTPLMVATFRRYGAVCPVYLAMGEDCKVFVTEGTGANALQKAVIKVWRKTFPTG